MSVIEKMHKARADFKWCIRESKIQAGGITFNQSERYILELISMGNENQEISDILCMSINTVATYRQRMHIKLGSRNAIELVEFAKALKII